MTYLARGAALFAVLCGLLIAAVGVGVGAGASDEAHRSQVQAADPAYTKSILDGLDRIHRALSALDDENYRDAREQMERARASVAGLLSPDAEDVAH